MADLDFLKFKKSAFDKLETKIDKAVIYGKLQALGDLAIYIDTLRESYTRLLVVNGISDDEDFKKKVIIEDSDTDDDLPHIPHITGRASP
tara:strand:- start:636 stop:905 length:270 start_codon:yes stop_codon:yes gene_type:complete